MIPIDRRTAVVLTPRRSGAPRKWSGNEWVTKIEHADVDAYEARGLNRAMGAFADRAVYGPTADSVEEASPDLGEAPRVMGSLFEELDPPSRLYDWFRVFAATTASPETARPKDVIDWATISDQDWGPFVVTELLFPDRTRGGVRLERDDLIVDLAYGVALRERRRRSGDVRTGALGIMELRDRRGDGRARAST